MNTSDLFIDGFGRVPEELRPALEGVTPEQLHARVGPEANTLAWLVWHLTRVQDAQVGAAFGGEQVWTAEGWVGRFGLPLDADDTGYGHTAEQIAAVRVESVQLLLRSPGRGAGPYDPAPADGEGRRPRPDRR